MADNTNQHYVHKGYLRPFCTSEGENSIALFNVSRQMYIPTASLKGECSKRYFYGKDPWYEGHMQKIEGHYNEVIRKIKTVGYSLEESDRKFLLRFWLFQHSRTEARAKEAVEMGNIFADAIDLPPEENDFDQDNAIRAALENFLYYKDQLDDLKTRLIKNKTKHAFVTSDDPAVLCNRWYTTDSRPKKYNFGGGLGSSGTTLILPLTPDLLFIAFDGDVYNLTHKKNWASITSVQDVSAFNQQQHLNCINNIYCVDAFNGVIAESESKHTMSTRSSDKYAFEYMVEEEKSINGGRLMAILEDGTRLVDASEQEAREIGKAMVTHRRIFPIPLNWPSILKFRPKGSVYTNGTYGGFMRRFHTEKEMIDQPDLVFWREPSTKVKG